MQNDVVAKLTLLIIHQCIRRMSEKLEGCAIQLHRVQHLLILQNFE